MPPRYAYWTILIDNRPTAFRAREREELLPTLNQLRRKNTDVVMKWFARGRLWDSPDVEKAAQVQPRTIEKRGHEWRPGGQHKDPRARFNKKKETGPGEQTPWRDKPAGPSRPGPSYGKKPADGAHPKRPWSGKLADGVPPKRPWSGKPAGPGCRRPPAKWPRKPKPSGRG